MSSNRGGVHFIKTTIVGGLLFLIPLVILVLVLSKAFRLMMMVAEPMAGWLPVDSVGGVTLANLIAAAALVLVCFVAGLVARATFLRSKVEVLENKVLSKLPGYVLIKGMLSGLQEDDSNRLYPVLARVANTRRMGLEIERMRDGRVVVLIPSSPTLGPARCTSWIQVRCNGSTSPWSGTRSSLSDSARARTSCSERQRNERGFHELRAPQPSGFALTAPVDTRL